MLDPTVKRIQYREATRFDDRGLPYKVHVYSFFIEQHGPLSEEFGAGDHHPAAVERQINERVRTMRDLGIIPQAQS
jgi:hypothetical protein